MRKIALSLVLCMLFGLCACSSQPEDLNKSSNPQEAETSQETYAVWSLRLLQSTGGFK